MPTECIHDAGLGGRSQLAQLTGDGPNSNSIFPPFRNTSFHSTHDFVHVSPLTFNDCTKNGLFEEALPPVLRICSFLSPPSEIVRSSNHGAPIKNVVCPVNGYNPIMFQRSHDCMEPASESPGRPVGVVE